MSTAVTGDGVCLGPEATSRDEDSRLNEGEGGPSPEALTGVPTCSEPAGCRDGAGSSVPAGGPSASRHVPGRGQHPKGLSLSASALRSLCSLNGVRVGGSEQISGVSVLSEEKHLAPCGFLSTCVYPPRPAARQRRPGPQGVTGLRVFRGEPGPGKSPPPRLCPKAALPPEAWWVGRVLLKHEKHFWVYFYNLSVCIQLPLCFFFNSH